MLCASDRIRAKSFCIRCCIRDFHFVHCIVHFPCTFLQVAIVLNTIFFRDSGSVVHVCFVVDLRIAQVQPLQHRLPASAVLRAAGGYFNVIYSHVHIINPSIYCCMAQEKADACWLYNHKIQVISRIA